MSTPMATSAFAAAIGASAMIKATTTIRFFTLLVMAISPLGWDRDGRSGQGYGFSVVFVNCGSAILRAQPVASRTNWCIMAKPCDRGGCQGGNLERSGLCPGFFNLEL